MVEATAYIGRGNWIVTLMVATVLWPITALAQTLPAPTPPTALFQGGPQADPSRLTTEQIYRAVGDLEKSINNQLASIVKNADEFKANLTHFPTEVDQKIAEMQKLQTVVTAAESAKNDERFRGIATQLKERDVRTELLATALKEALNQAAVSQKTAVDAALQAQEKSSNAQAVTLISSLGELKATFGKLLDAQQMQIANLKDDSAKAIATIKDDTTRSISTLNLQVAAINSHAGGISDVWQVVVGGGGLVGLVLGGMMMVGAISKTRAFTEGGSARVVYVPDRRAHNTHDAQSQNV